MLPPEPVGSIAVFSRAAHRIPNLAALCGAKRLQFRPSDAAADSIDAVLHWGADAKAQGLAYAKRHDLPIWYTEEGFIQAIKPPPVSILLDDCSSHDNANTASRLERWLASDEVADAELRARARNAMDHMLRAGVAHDNLAPPLVAEGRSGSLRSERQRVLVIDQRTDDKSIRRGLGTPQSFQDMLDAACDENPDADILIRAPGTSRGHLAAATGERIHHFTRDVPILALVQQVDRVYVVTSLHGFEALMAGRPVTCFGAPWYAGWAATDDRVTIRRRGRARSVEGLFAAAYMLYARYLNPNTGQPCEIEEIIEHLALQRANFAHNRGRLFCFGFRFFKKAYIRSYLRCPGNEIIFVSSAAVAERHGLDQSSRLVVWGQRDTPELRGLAARRNLPIWRVEDGFLRSVGLGSDWAMPASLVFDKTGLYYDPRHPSDLESLLEHDTFTPAEIERAASLRERIVGTAVEVQRRWRRCPIGATRP